MAGEDEIKNNSITFRIMSTGEQKKIELKEIDRFVRDEIKNKR
jgi:histidyl-tRNA synthetase